MTVKVAPRPSPALSAWTVPPWSSTSSRTRVRPRPRPVWLWDGRALRLAEALEDVGQELRGDPLAGVADGEVDVVPHAAGPDRDPSAARA